MRQGNGKALTQLKWINREIQTDQKMMKHLIFPAETSLLIQERMLKRRKQLLAEAERICNTIDGIEDSFLRQIFTLRYIGGCNWTQIAMKMGGGNTPDGIRMLHNRYLQKNG